MTLSQLLRAVTKICQVGAWFKTVPQAFPRSPYATRACVVLWWAGTLLRVSSAEHLERWIRAGKFRRLAPGFPSADTLRRHLAALPPDLWHGWVRRIAQRLAQMRAWSRVGGHRVVALDGVEWFSQHAVQCADCTTRVIDEVPQYVHKAVVASVIGAVPIVLEWEAQRPGETDLKGEAEWRAVQRLLPRLWTAFHHQIEVVVADAECCTQVFLQAVRARGWDAVVRLKNERLTIWQDAQGLWQLTPPVVNRRDWQLWDLSDLAWGPVTDLRVVVWPRWAGSGGGRRAGSRPPRSSTRAGR